MPLLRPFPHYHTPSTMQTFLASSTLCLALGLGFFYALTTSLTDLTTRDCQAGVERACYQLRQDGVQQ